MPLTTGYLFLPEVDGDAKGKFDLKVWGDPRSSSFGTPFAILGASLERTGSSRGSTTRRSYTAGRFALNLDGQQTDGTIVMTRNVTTASMKLRQLATKRTEFATAYLWVPSDQIQADPSPGSYMKFELTHTQIKTVSTTGAGGGSPQAEVMEFHYNKIHWNYVNIEK